MPTKQQIITIGVLCVVTLGLGYWDGKPQKPSRQSNVEAQLAIKKSTLTNVDSANLQDPILEKAVRERRQKPTGELTKADLGKVEYLNLTSAKISDENLRELTKLTQLKSLYLNNTKITDVSLKEIAKMKQLTKLDLRATKVTKRAMIQLKNALPKCKIYSNPTK